MFSQTVLRNPKFGIPTQRNHAQYTSCSVGGSKRTSRVCSGNDRIDSCHLMLADTSQMGEKLHSMRCQILIQTSRILDLVHFSDNSSAVGDTSSLASPAQEGDACISAFSELQTAVDRLMLMSSDLISQGKEDTSRILKMDGEIKSGRAVIEGLREEVRNSVPRKPNTDMFTQTITVTSSAFSQTEPSSDDSASRRATPLVTLSKPPPDMESLSQFLSK